MIEQRSDRQPETTKMGRTKLVSIIAIAFVPILVAYFVFFNFPDMLPERTTNQGTLIQPPIQLEGLEIEPRRKWVLLIPVDSNCDEVCQQVLYLSRQVHIGLGKDSARVQRVILTEGNISTDFGELLQAEHGEAMVIDVASKETGEQLKGLVPDGTYKLTVFVMDPNGNVMMYYRPEQGGKPMLKDLKHLLKTSNIG